MLMIGVSCKNDVDDLGEFPALDVVRLLRNRGAEVACHDP